MSKALIALLLTAVSAWAQDARATIGGRITDGHGAIVPNAAIAVVSGDTGVQQKTVANEQGAWSIQFLLPGHYRFSVTAPGFKTSLRDGITLQAADNKQFDVQLEVGAINQSVE